MGPCRTLFPLARPKMNGFSLSRWLTYLRSRENAFTTWWWDVRQILTKLWPETRPCGPEVAVFCPTHVWGRQKRSFDDDALPPRPVRLHERVPRVE